MKKIPWLRIIVHIYGWLPLAQLIFAYINRNLGPNPIQAMEQRTGLQALIFLVLSLACTPIASITGWREFSSRRKALGNYGFMYAACHLGIFIGIDYTFDLEAIFRDVGTKKYILVGLLAFVFLLSLAVTSFKYMMKLLGKNWKKLHRLAYVISPLVIFHFLLSAKGNILRMQGNIAQPLLYGAIVLILLLLRIPKIKTAISSFKDHLQNRMNKSAV